MADLYDLVVIGAGPGGYVAAIRGAQLGMSVACIDLNDQLGGTCLRVGCIPSKALLESSERFFQARRGSFEAHGIKLGGVELDLQAMLDRKSAIVKQLTQGIAGLFKKNKVTRYQGLGRLAGDTAVDVVGKDGKITPVSGKNILIATGSEPSTIPGVEFDGHRVGSSTDALAYAEVPENLVVIGAGVIGLEMGSVWNRLGSRVTLLEYAPTLLPMVDTEVAKMAGRLFKKQGLTFKLGVKVTSTAVEGEHVTVAYEDGGTTESVAADRVLVATGRRPNTEGLQAAEHGVRIDERGFILVNERYETGAPGVWAIGDVIGGPMLAHKAEEEGIAAVENMTGKRGHVNYTAIPSIIYTHPEVASVGRSEQELQEANIPYKKGKFPFAANGRAKAMGDTDGFVKILAHAETDRILGFHVLGPHASELIAEAAVAVEFSASAEDLALSVHAHPTLSEVVKEAALAVAGRVIHI